jgi:IclR family transcriptional regulator, KDG regulon repressor
MNSAKKLFAVLEDLCINGRQGVSELSSHLKLGKSSIHRFLSVLVEAGYVSQNPENKRYFATFKVFELGAMVRGRRRLIAIARPYMEKMGQQFHETINLGLLDGDEVVYVDQVQSAQTLRMDLGIGRRVPAYCTASGKVFLANLPEHEVKGYFERVKLVPRTLKTITDDKELMKHFEVIRKRGFAIDDRELDMGIRCIAAPLRDDSGKVAAVISIAGPTIRVGAGKMKHFREALMQATKQISGELGFSGR